MAATPHGERRAPWRDELLRRTYERGAYRLVERLAGGGSEQDPARSPQREVLRALAMARSGRASEAMRVLVAVQPSPTLEQLEVLRFTGLAPPAAFIERLDGWRGILATIQSVDERVRWHILSTCRHVQAGLFERALFRIERARRRTTLGPVDGRLDAMRHVQAAEVHRLLGDHQAARAALHQADQAYLEGAFTGDRADLYQAAVARVEAGHDRAGAMQALRSRAADPAASGQSGRATRTMLLEARLATRRAMARRRHRAVLELRERTPDLAACVRLGYVLDHWGRWTSGAGRPMSRCRATSSGSCRVRPGGPGAAFESPGRTEAPVHARDLPHAGACSLGLALAPGTRVLAPGTRVPQAPESSAA